MTVLIKGGGDIASGIALRLFRCGFNIVMTEIPHPSAIRRTVSFSEAVYHGKSRVEEIEGILVKNTDEIPDVMSRGQIPVIVSPACDIAGEIKPDVVVDAIIAKRNTGTSMGEAPLVIGLGPGFTAGIDCHRAVETCRGHYLGRVIYSGSPIANTGIPGEIGGESIRRILHSPRDGEVIPMVEIGDTVKKGDVTATVGGESMPALIDGTVRGMLPRGFIATKGMKSGDIDPRCKKEHCYTVSDKALAIGGGVLEAILSFQRGEA